MHLGMIIVAFSVFGGAKLWHERWSGRFEIARLKWLPIVLILVAPFVFAKKLRFDRAPMTVHYRQVGAEISTLLGANDRIFIADPRGSGESAAILGFELRSGAKPSGFVSAFNGDRFGEVKLALECRRITTVIVYTQFPGYQDLFHQKFPPQTSVLVKRQAISHPLKLEPGEEWQIVETWAHPG